MNYSDLSIDQWIAKNCINKIHVSHLALQLVANLYKIKIIVYQLFEADGITEIFTLENENFQLYMKCCAVLSINTLLKVSDSLKLSENRRRISIGLT